jgi:outer membrane lipoprotein-sorting protein
MSTSRIALTSFFVGAALSAQAIETPLAASQQLGAAQIVARNAAARGGAEAWEKVRTLTWIGHVESSNALRPKLPFILQQKRPDRTRFEIGIVPQKSVRIFDGNEGWKVRANANGRPELVAYSADEMIFARDAQVIEGPLMDCVARHAGIDLVGTDEVQGRKAYVLEARVSTGNRHRVWVDAETFLELRDDREVRNAAGRTGVVSVFFRDYRAQDGLQMPRTVETVSASGQETNRLVIEKVDVNPRLDDQAFTKPTMPGVARRGVTVDTRSAAQSARPTPLP